MKKKLNVLAIVLCLILAFATSVTYVGAAQIEEPSVEPLWQNTSSVRVDIGYIDGIAYAESLVIADIGTTSITTEVKVFRQHGNYYVRIAKKQDTEYDYVGGMSCPFEPVEGVTYCAQYTFTVVKDGISEVITRSCYRTF